MVKDAAGRLLKLLFWRNWLFRVQSSFIIGVDSQLFLASLSQLQHNPLNTDILMAVYSVLVGCLRIKLRTEGCVL